MKKNNLVYAILFIVSSMSYAAGLKESEVIKKYATAILENINDYDEGEIKDKDNTNDTDGFIKNFEPITNIEAFKQSITYIDEHGFCSIHYATKCCKKATLRALLALRPDAVDIMDREKRSPLYFMCKRIMETDDKKNNEDRFEIVRILILNKANCHYCDEEGLNLFQMITNNIKEENILTTSRLRAVMGGAVKEEFENSFDRPMLNKFGGSKVVKTILGESTGSLD